MIIALFIDTENGAIIRVVDTEMNLYFQIKKINHVYYMGLFWIHPPKLNTIKVIVKTLES